MAVLVVHLLEAIEVDHEQRAVHAIAAPVHNVAVQLLLEAAAVVEPSEGVTIGDVAQPLLHRGALGFPLARLGHVDACADHMRDVSVRVGQGRVRPLDQAQLAGARAPVELRPHG
jgi:hypothetical protein